MLTYVEVCPPMMDAVSRAGFDAFFMTIYLCFDELVESARAGDISVDDAAQQAVHLMREIYTDDDFDPADSPFHTFAEVIESRGLQHRFRL